MSDPIKKVKHPDTKSTKDAPLVPEVQRNVESEKNKSSEDEDLPSQRIYHNNPKLQERPISSVYPVIDTDLARDNVENDLSDADLQDL